MSKPEDETAAKETSKRANTSRSRYAGWLTRSIKQFESAGDVPSVLEAIRQRITLQLNKLQDSHDAYISTLTEDNDIEEADEWMERYFDAATKALSEIETKLHAKNMPQPISQENSEESKPQAPKQDTPNIPGTSSTVTDSSNGSASVIHTSTDQSQSESKFPSGPADVATEQVQSPAARFDPLQTSKGPQVPAKPIDAWIDELEIGAETARSTPTSPSDLGEALARLEMGRDLPRIELPVFDGSPLTWPRFVEQFHAQVHSRCGLDDTRRMDLLQSHVKGEAKRLIEGLGFSSRNYALALKELKFAFGHRIAVARAHIGTITKGNVIAAGDPIALRNFYVLVRDCIATLGQMNYVSEISSGDVLQRTACRIPFDKRVKWNDYIRNICRIREPSLTDLEKWLKECVESEINPYAVPTRSNRDRPNSTQAGFGRINSNTVGSSSTSSEMRSCPLCSSTHYLSRCKEYSDKTPEDRYELVKSLNLCFNCLSNSHRIADCKSTTTCKFTGCTSKHHTTLHRKRPQASGGSSSPQGQVHNLHSLVVKVHFQVMPVVILGNNGRRVSTFALLDSASDVTMISSDLAEDLGLRGKSETLTLNTLNSSSCISSKRVNFSVRSQNDPDSEVLRINEAWTKPGAFKCSTLQAADLRQVDHLRGIRLTDVKPEQVKLLIGANVPRAHVQLDRRLGSPNDPIAIRTLLGWCILGPSAAGTSGQHRLSARVNFISSQRDDLSAQMEQFWKTESFGVTANFKKPVSIEDHRATLSLQTGTMLKEGRFEVPMLWKDNLDVLPNNKPQALQRFASLQRRLSADPQLQDKYAAVVNSYVSDGYARKLTAAEAATTNNKTWYLPHHCVTNVNKPGKVRVVFDAAAVHDGISLNSQLMTGPDMTNSLFAVIQRFRMKPVAIVADIKEMFHQVRVPEADSDALRFLWKEDLINPGSPEVFKMLVHIFGAKDSPCCVNYALREAVSEADEEVQQTVFQNFYVDDMLCAVHDVPSAITLARSLQEVLSNHGFQLTKWMSSSKEVLASLPASCASVLDFDMDLERLCVQRALGLYWKVQDDNFVFNPVCKDAIMTKRSLLSAISSVFDPCGFLAPFTFRAKCLLQDLWRANLGWDDVIPDDLKVKWCAWREEFHFLKDLRIPRYHGCTIEMNLELHIFCDASEAGFAAVAYLRMIHFSGIRCSFLASRCHVAPLKPVLSIPKLELQGAVMAVRLASTLCEILDANAVVFWTDSMTVLRYISNEERRWKIFVANRIAEIREHTEVSQWRYVPSSQNPADDATRGLSAEVMVAESRWFRGPKFLYFGEDGWPPQTEIGPLKSDDENLRSSATVQTVHVALPDQSLRFDLRNLLSPENFSSWLRLLRHVAWLLRAVKIFLCTVRSLSDVTKATHLTPPELQEAEFALVSLVQMDSFPAEYQSLQRNEDVSEKSKLLSLNPFLDADGSVIRVGGRLQRAVEVGEAKHQIILPDDHHVTRLITRDLHLRQAHCGPEHLIASLRQRFWPLRCRRMCKKVIYDCLDCRRKTVKPVVPLMADLPLQRISGFTRPFQFTGLDYFGPILVKRARSRVKRWGCLFTCLVTRAVHLEVADSLQTDDFIMTLRCFIGRRGPPAEIFSDNGTNFRGAERELTDNLVELHQGRINDFLLQNRTSWHFVPPHAPHFGGVWESLVKSTKKALQAVLKDQVVTETVLRTTLIEVEAVINSRPLTYNSSDANDLTALTPNHFLHGGATNLHPPGTFHDQDLYSRKRWRQCQVLADHTWKRWLKEYLPTLTVRNKWRSEQRDLQLNDLVLVVDEIVPRGQWPLGRVTGVFPSADGRIRSVKVKTSTGEYHRPASKICFLEEEPKNS